MSRAWAESGMGPRELLLSLRRMTIVWCVMTFVLRGISQGCCKQGIFLARYVICHHLGSSNY